MATLPLLALVALLEKSMGLDPDDIRANALNLRLYLEGQAPTYGRKQMVVAVDRVITEYGGPMDVFYDSSDDDAA